MTELGYTKSLLVIFVIPFALLFRTIIRTVEPKPFWTSIAVISVIGWVWSVILSYKKWWIFSGKDILGLHIFPHLPLEEFVIYPIGGAFSIFLYLVGSRTPRRETMPYLVWTIILLTTAAFVAVAVRFDSSPYYLYSQLLVYNVLAISLAVFAASGVNGRGLFISVAILSSIGFLWDLLAFHWDWWVYTAVTGVQIFRIPIEDINFYLMAPTSAILIYVVLCRLFSGSPNQGPSS